MSYCTRCGAYIPIGETACPACGYDPEEEKRAEEKAAEEKKKAEEKAAEEKKKAEEKAAEEKKKAEAAAAAAASAQSHSGSYGTQGAYQSAPHGYQSAHQTQSQTGSYSYQSQSGAYQSQQGAYQSQQGAYQSQQSGYQSQQSGYQSQQQSQQQTQAMTWAPWNQQNQKEDPREDAGTPLNDNDEEYIPEELRRLSVLSYIGPLFILPMLRHKNNDFVRFHANQGLSLFILENVLGWIFGGGILDAIGTIFCIYCVVLGAKNAAAGRKGELPIVGKWRILK